jgi:RNA polymerase subunit RPABC4/transcription elongation factor Spt4
MQEELRVGLEAKLPEIRRYRAFSDARVSLNPALIPPPGHIRYAPPEVRERVELVEATTEAAEGSLDASAGADSGSSIGELEPDETDPEEVEHLPDETAEPVNCPVCSAVVPGGSSYCPYCGARVVPGTCVGCGAMLDPTWVFCPECGRQREDRSVGSP